MNEAQIRRAVELWNAESSISVIAHRMKVTFRDLDFLITETDRFLSARPGRLPTDPIMLNADEVVARALGDDSVSSDHAEKPLTRNQQILQQLRREAPRKGKFVVSWEGEHGVSGSLDHADADKARETFARIVLCSVAGTKVSWIEDGAVVARCVVEDC